MIPRLAFAVLAVSIVAAREDQEKECPSCGKKPSGDAKFCGGCGKKLPAEKPPEEKPREKKVPKGLEGVGLTAEQVNDAIARGADFLIQQFKKKEIRPKEMLLCGLALLHAKALDRDASVGDAIRKYLNEVSINMLGTYNVAILAMLLDELGTDPQRLADCAKYFVETQGKDGSWAYGKWVPQVGEPKARKVVRKLVVVDGGEPIDEPGPSWIEVRRENPPDFTGSGDNSTTQYAILGLRAAARSGIGIPKDVWKRCYDVTVSRFHKSTGGWAYNAPGNAYGSMNTAAATTLAICAYHLGNDPFKDEWVRKGADWMGKNFSVAENPGRPKWWIGYYLYGLERLGVILGDAFFGDHEWYPLGAQRLVHSQAENGSWKLDDEGNPLFSTMFALLFLTKATPPLKREIKRGGSGKLITELIVPDETVTETIPSDGEYFHLILDASGSMMKSMGGRKKSELAVEAIDSLVKSLPDHASVGLRVYGNRKRALDDGADEDSTLEIPIAKIDRAAYMAKVRSIRFQGKTPIAYSLRQAGEDLKGLPADAEVTVILLTDGLETTPEAKPAQAAAELVKRPKTKLRVIAFDLGQGEQDQIKAISDAAQGEFVPAPDAAALVKGMVRTVTRTVKRAVDFILQDGEGREVWRGRLGEQRTLSEGKYVLLFKKDGKEIRQEVWVNTDAVTRVTVDYLCEAK